MQPSSPAGAVSLLKTETYEQAALRPAIAEHFRLLGISIPHTQPVVIKPNLILRCGPERAATVHPAVLEALLAHLRAMGLTNLLIAESPGGPYTPALLKGLYEKTGIAAAARKYDVPCNLSVESAVRTRQDNLLCGTFDIIAPVTKEAFLINLCKVKTHGMMTMSAGVKNLFGCVPGLLKPQLHYRFPDEALFARMLVDLSQLLRPQLTLVDGVMGMEGDGPTAGTPRFLGITAAARFDGLYALDAMLAAMIGLHTEQVPTLMEARARGLLDTPLVCGDCALAERVTPFRPPTGKSLDFTGSGGVFRPILRLLKPYMAPRPQVRKSLCIGCGKCAETCPAAVISISGGKAVIRHKECIRCFCCHEMCPVQAIQIREMALFRLLSKQ